MRGTKFLHHDLSPISDHRDDHLRRVFDEPGRVLGRQGSVFLENLLDFIASIEKALGKRANMVLLPMQPGDVAETCADITESTRDLGFRPTTRIEEGIGRFVAWYRSYYGE